MTHFASVSDFTCGQKEEKKRCFFGGGNGLRQAGIEARYIHLSSTGGIAYRQRETWGNMVRPGHGIYGYVSPVRGAGPAPALKVKPVMCWKAAVLTVKEIARDAQVGYGG